MGEYIYKKGKIKGAGIEEKKFWWKIFNKWKVLKRRHMRM